MRRAGLDASRPGGFGQTRRWAQRPSNTVEGVEPLGHTGCIGAYAFRAPGYDAVLAGTHNASEVDRWPLVAALSRELHEAA